MRRAGFGGDDGATPRRVGASPDNNRLLATSLPADPSGTFSATYGYGTAASNDGGLHGSMTSMPHLAELHWDHADRLQFTSKSVGSNQHTYFTYDAAGERVRKVYEHDGIVEERIYLGGYELYRRRSGTLAGPVQVERQTLHVMDDTRRVALVETKTVDTLGADATPIGVARWRYQLDNHLGSSALELSEAAAVISYEEYHPYGTTAFHSTSGAVSQKRYRYTGKEKDDETGLYYHGARYYAPWLGRWTAADPNQSAGINRYQYVSSNPLRLRDPNGEEGEEGGFWGGVGNVLREKAGAFVDGAAGAAEGINNYLKKTGEALGDLAYGAINDDTEATIRGGEALVESLEVISIQNQARVAEEVVVGTVESLGEATVGIGTESVAIYDAVRRGDSQAAGEHTAKLVGNVAEVGLAVVPAAKGLKALSKAKGLKVPNSPTKPRGTGGTRQVRSPKKGNLEKGTPSSVTRSDDAFAEGHTYARKVSPGGTGDALAGHGELRTLSTKELTTTVPEGTSITLPREGVGLSDDLARLVEAGDWDAIAQASAAKPEVALQLEGMATYLPGARVPNYTLKAPTDLHILENSITVETPTLLSEVLGAFEGSNTRLCWAACTKVKSR